MQVIIYRFKSKSLLRYFSTMFLLISNTYFKEHLWMTACVIIHSGESFITLEQGTFVLCDTGMNIVFIYFFSNLAHTTNHLVSWNLYFANCLVWIIMFGSALRVEVKINALLILNYSPFFKALQIIVIIKILVSFHFSDIVDRDWLPLRWQNV